MSIACLNKDKFLALAESKTNAANASSFIEDCAIGDMTIYGFDEWLFADTTKMGDYTKTAIKTNDGYYMVAFFAKQNSTPEWESQTIAMLFDEDFAALEAELNAKYSSKITSDGSALSNLGSEATHYCDLAYTKQWYNISLDNFVTGSVISFR